MKLFDFNPTLNKTPRSASLKNEKVLYEIKIQKQITVDKLFFVYSTDGGEKNYNQMRFIKSDELYNYFSIDVIYNKEGLYWYFFEVVTQKEIFFLTKSADFNVEKSEKAQSSFLQLVYAKPSTAKSYAKGIIYHIFVDRFNKAGTVEARNGLNLRPDWGGEIVKTYENGEFTNTDCFGGNLRGIIEKLDYIKSLNTSLIYLSPVFEAHSNHKYNTADYSKIDSMFGTMEDFKELVAEADKRGMGVLLDGVFNHTGSDSVYFNKNGRYKDLLGAYQSKNSLYYDWYHFRHFPDDYACWWNVKSLPETNDKANSYVEFICGENGIIERYTKTGIAGFRLDVVDELNDLFIDQICAAIRRINEKALIVGEVWEDASCKISYGKRKRYFHSGQLDSVTNYPVKNGIINFVKYGDVTRLAHALDFISDQYPVEVQNNLMNILDTHDTIRILTALGSKDYYMNNEPNENFKLKTDELKTGRRLLKMATLIQYTIMGIPAVFYGDEAGVQGIKDPYCRSCYPWGNEDAELLEWYKTLGKLRNESVFADGGFSVVKAEDGVLVYKRFKGSDLFVAAVNKGELDFTINLTQPMKDYFTDKKYTDSVELKTDSFILLHNKL